jgi:phosphatidylglycerophosphate synthase
MLAARQDEKNLGGESDILRGELRSWWVHGIVGPIENWLIRRHVKPHHITYFGMFLVFVVSILFAFGKFFWAGWLLLIASSFDFLDGRVARATNTASDAGAYLDSLTDRYMDAFLFAGLTYFFRDHWLIFFTLAALFGSLIVSYAKSRAQEFNIDCSVGLMQRPERLAYLSFGAVMSSYIQIALMPFWAPTHYPPQHLLIGLIVILSIATNITALQRIRFTMRELDRVQNK